MVPDAPNQPNILLVVADHLRTDAFGCYGTSAAQTPAIDRLAGGGWKFEACYTACPSVEQSLAWLLAGGQPSENGYNWISSLHQSGYQLSVIGCEADLEIAAGEARAEAACDQLRRLADQQPFCLVVHLGDVLAIEPPSDLELRGEHVPPPIFVPRAVQNRPRFVRRLHHDADQAARLPGSTSERLALRRDYYRRAGGLDRCVGQLLELLDERQLTGRTLVAVAGLTGCMLGDHDLAGPGPFAYESQVNVPLILRAPGELEGGHACHRICQLHDLAGTLLDATGTDAPTGAADSRLPTAGQFASASRYAMSFDTCGKRWILMVRQGFFKLILYHTGRDDIMEGELFDLEHDWYELNSLWDLPEYWQVRVELTERALDWVAEIRQLND